MIYKKTVSLFIWGEDREFKQVTKPNAAKAFENGKLLLFQSSNVPIDSFLFRPCPVLKGQSYDDNFDGLCNDYRYYNCDNERGKYIRFFVEI